MVSLVAQVMTIGFEKSCFRSDKTVRAEDWNAPRNLLAAASHARSAVKGSRVHSDVSFVEGTEENRGRLLRRDINKRMTTQRRADKTKKRIQSYFIFGSI